MLEFFSGLGCLFIAFLFFRLERNTYKKNVLSTYLDIANQIKFYGLILILIMTAAAFFFGWIKY
ncbi:MAG: hypothetical protein CVU08_09025 [Bacteroidetes bacterium HGW-Bacteroidetes-3]|jgi:hypothetical protein|nr:MAG: hypothetical protein CVU08_09025 [Bacteroidetes bacterium HGW-Bacteroidetes-3]